MEQINFGSGSLKNIPVLGNKREHRVQVIQSIHALVNKCRWEAKNALNPWARGQKKETYGFKSLRAAPKVPELVPFERDLFEMAKNIKYNNQRGKRSELQRRLMKDVAAIKKQTNVIVASDKTSNFYLVDTNSYRNMINRDIQKVYRKAGDEVEKDMNEKGKVIATKLELEDRIFATQKRQASITVKDHKSSFPNTVETRLINPTKAELGRVSKQKLDKVLTELRRATGLSQWRNDVAVVNWFNSLERKENLKFIELDIVQFYPSISKELFTLALDWAASIVDISEEDRELYLHTKQSLLVNDGCTWVKKGPIKLCQH